MFAIVKLGNQQFKVKAGDFIRAPYQNHSLEKKFNLPVLAFGNETDFVFDSSQLKKSRVQALVVRQSLSRKVLVFKKKRRKAYRRTQGHRQKITEIRILELKSPSGQVSKVETKPSTKSKTKKPGVKKVNLTEKVSSEKKKPSGSKKTSHKKVKKEAVRALKRKEDKKTPKQTKNRTESPQKMSKKKDKKTS